MNIDVLRVIFNIVVTIGLGIVGYAAKEHSDCIKTLQEHCICHNSKQEVRIKKLEKKVKELEKELRR